VSDICVPAQHVTPNPQVETWLVELEWSMRLSLKDIIRRSLDDMKVTEREQWIVKWPGQVCLLRYSGDVVAVCILISCTLGCAGCWSSGMDAGSRGGPA